MLSPLDFLSDLTNPLLSFLPKALLVALVCSVVAGVIGSHVVLRGMRSSVTPLPTRCFPGWPWPSSCRGRCCWAAPSPG